METLVYGTCIAFRIGRENRAVLIRGKSASGKSDLALRALALGAKLVSDDQVILKSKGRFVLQAMAPKPIKGLLEVRGVGICREAGVLSNVPLALVVDLVPRSRVPRLPDAEFEVIAGVKLPRRKLYAFEVSAALKLYKMMVE